MMKRNIATRERRAFDAQELVSELFGRPLREVPETKLAIVKRLFHLEGPLPQPAAEVAQRIVRKHHDTMALAQEHNLSIKLIGFGTAPETFAVFEGPDCDWVLLNVANDPLYRHYDERLPVPSQVEDEIRRLSTAGINFPATFIAHAVAKGVMANRNEVTLDLVVPSAAPRVVARLKFLDRGISKVRQTTEAALRGIAVAGASLSAGALAVPALAAAALPVVAVPLALADPILLASEVIDGWIADGGRPIHAVYYVTHWYYWNLEDNRE